MDHIDPQHLKYTLPIIITPQLPFQLKDRYNILGLPFPWLIVLCCFNFLFSFTFSLSPPSIHHIHMYQSSLFHPRHHDSCSHTYMDHNQPNNSTTTLLNPKNTIITTIISQQKVKENKNMR